ncbi:flavin reductase family protein [Nonomuraea maritima]|uniref:flavin reductase family protein n=1 Tax=Nonomuraea maritima TaxID=683260 RepID=UPI00371E63BA
MSTRAARTGKTEGCRGVPVMPRRRRTRRGTFLPPAPALRTRDTASTDSGDGGDGCTVDGRRFRQALGTFATGVVAVTAADPRGGRPYGLAVNSFTSVSLDPPLVAFCVSHTSTSWPRVRAAGEITVNVLAGRQREACAQLASRGGDKFAGLGWTASPSGNPILDGALAWLDCAIEAEHVAGDHTIVVTRVLRLDLLADGDPLVFFRGAYGSFTADLSALAEAVPAP